MAAPGFTETDYEVGGRRYVGALVAAAQTPRALAVLLPDWHGRSPLALDHAAHLAELGCTTLVADLYGDGYTPNDPSQVTPMVQHLLEHRSDGVAALSAAVAAIRRVAGMPQLPLVVVAFSAGAVAALDHGRRTSEAAAIVVCSGLLKTAEPGTSTKVGASVLLVQGTQDAVSPMPVVAELVEEADAAGNDLRLLLLSHRPTMPSTTLRRVPTRRRDWSTRRRQLLAHGPRSLACSTRSQPATPQDELGGGPSQRTS